MPSSGSFSVVEIQQSAQAFAPRNAAAISLVRAVRHYQNIPDSLVMAFAVIVQDELRIDFLREPSPKKIRRSRQDSLMVRTFRARRIRNKMIGLPLPACIIVDAVIWSSPRSTEACRMDKSSDLVLDPSQVLVVLRLLAPILLISAIWTRGPHVADSVSGTQRRECSG